VKLLETLAAQVAKVGPLQRAWLTTFSLNLDLLEGYILPTLVGEERPRKASDFEMLQSQIYSAEGSRALDIKVFYDPHTGSLAQAKRTSVPIYPVDFRSANLLPREKPFRKGFFHPKVIYLQGERGAVIGAGSANLTIDGWSQNRECFHFEILKGRRNRLEVKKLFERMHIWCGLEAEFTWPTISRSENECRQWSFTTSLSEEKVLDLLVPKSRAENLTVWAPYLSMDLARLARTIEERFGVEKFHVVPDLHPDGKMRLSCEAGRDFLDAARGHALLKDEGSDWSQRFSHAKLFMTSEDIAIGSWNLTNPALGLSREKQNVEAGFVLFGRNIKLPRGLSHLSPEADGKDVATLANDERSFLAMELPPVPVVVTFDWKSRSWSWVLPDGPWLGMEPRLILPVRQGQFERVNLRMEPTGQRLIKGIQFFLRDRTVEVQHLENGTERSSSVWILESHPEERPSASFDGWESLIAGLIQGSPEMATEGLRSPYDGSEEGEKDNGKMDGSSKQGFSTHQGPTVTYFRLFAAMNSAKLTLEQAKDPLQLRRRIALYPGCLREILETSASLVQEGKEGSTMFRWFLVQELRTLVRLAQRRWKMLANEEIPPYPFKELFDLIPALPPLDTGDVALLDDLQKVCVLEGYR